MGAAVELTGTISITSGAGNPVLDPAPAISLTSHGSDQFMLVLWKGSNCAKGGSASK